jgi:hypothetical protein
MKIENPSYADAQKAKIPGLKAKVKALFDADTTKRFWTMDEIKAALPADAADLTEGMLSQIATANGWNVTNT